MNSKFKESKDGRFIVHRKHAFGVQGLASPPYVLEDTVLDNKKPFQSMQWAECCAQKRVNGLELAPYFPNGKDGHVKDIVKKDKILVVNNNEWYEVENG